MREKLLAAGIAVAVLTVATAIPASAQMSNEPFSFRGVGPGMSNAARQAIIDERLTGSTPRNLLRGPGDQLLDVQKGPGSSAIVREADGTLLPGYRGTSAFSPGMGAGIFNAFFLFNGSSSGSAPFYGGSFMTRAGLAGWTGMVADGPGGGSIPISDSPVDAWTSQVFVYYGL